MNIFCCFGKGQSTQVNEADLPAPERALSDASSARGEQSNRFTPDFDPLTGERGQSDSVFGEATALAAGDSSVLTFDSVFQERAKERLPSYPISCHQNPDEGPKYQYTGKSAIHPTPIAVNFDLVQFGSNLNYGNDQTGFAIGTANSIGFCKDFLRSGDSADIQCLIEYLGMQRAELAREKRHVGFGVERQGELLTVLVGARYCDAGDDMEASFHRRQLQGDASLQVTDLSDLDDDDFAQVKEAYLNGKQYYVRYQPVFETNNGDRLKLTNLVICSGSDLPVTHDVRSDLINPFDYEKDGKLDLSEIEGDFVQFVDGFARKTCLEKLRILNHPRKEEVALLTAEMESQLVEFREATDRNDKDKMLESGSNLAFLLSNAAPYMRGSAWAGEVLASSVMQMVTEREDINFVGTNLDFVAFGCSADEFRQCMVDYAVNLPRSAEP